MKRPITSLRVRNFKAVEDTGILRPEGLTVFIGDNGTGKSSVLEALRFVADLAREPLDRALDPFGGYEHVRWKGGKKRGHAAPEAPMKEYHPLEIKVRGHVGQVKASATTRLSGQNQNVVVFDHEELTVGAEQYTREAGGDQKLRPDRSILGRTSWFDDWQFLDMVPGQMGRPVRRGQSGAAVKLAPDGSNLAEYLVDLRNVPELGTDAFEGLLETLQVILPYVRDLEPVMSEMLERQVALRLHEGSFTVPGWMLSTGTLRLVALLALLRHPRPPSLLCVEEVENGLDPRTIHVVVDELMRAAEGGRTQIVITTHSPYLLDLVPLESLVLVAREAGKPPRFDRPADHEEVREWAQRFAPGRLYTMGTLHQRREG
ncbi:MAG TPA: AAA family ATPase [Candidatus Nanopelagicales bacterium]|nr:AAA family ATPase [Candidatus Nanopelagicales bacterium]